jgi:hypothetical protein
LSFAEYLLQHGSLSLSFYIQPLSGPSKLLDFSLHLEETSSAVNQVHLIDPVYIPSHITEIQQCVINTAPRLSQLAL